ncbi:uncharacterized protein LOC117585949 [Drosophila guanche]|uniref:Single domain-containing protein n=1 Tax=Drosophila guanche TaxID=7266 RepID=A0A3B0J4V2_DROGU|nr:uncharacterized protein LOC117585949 [Drosophila guanche]SPP74623.1 Hypothetical predicted protein [Drosophila guanche]
MSRNFILMGLMLLPLVHSLVHFKNVGPGAKGGCKGRKGDLRVYGMEDDPNVCGALHCQNDKGDALIHYCQIPGSFAMCRENGVASSKPWPECCWICVELIDCAKEDTQVSPDPPTGTR